jgi:hypothetical protein
MTSVYVLFDISNVIGEHRPISIPTLHCGEREPLREVRLLIHKEMTREQRSIRDVDNITKTRPQIFMAYI